jgi:CheY-like chemotaxis protein
MVSRNSAPDSVESADWSARQAFFDAISLDIRRPLDGVLAVTDLLQRQHLPADAQAYVRTIIEHHQRLLRALADAADLGRAEMGALEVSPQPTELRPLMDSIQAEWQSLAAQGGVSLSIAYDGEDIAAQVDAVRVQQLFNNLIDRALKVTRRGGVEASLHARREAGGLVIEGRVRDSGAALAPERMARIFEAGGADGESGMSMVLCRRIAEALNGSIRAEANAGAGSTITFSFMAEETQFGEEPEAQHASRAAHVLVVDDNATNRMVAEALCEMFDCTSECAEDGVEAVEAARSGRFDLILMDIKMPRMDGVEATRAIRALGGRAGSAPIIALTANADPEDARGYIAAGMSAVVEKPIKPEALLAAMNACLPDAGEQSQAAAA